MCAGHHRAGPARLCAIHTEGQARGRSAAKAPVPIKPLSLHRRERVMYPRTDACSGTRRGSHRARRASFKLRRARPATITAIAASSRVEGRVRRRARGSPKREVTRRRTQSTVRTRRRGPYRSAAGPDRQLGCAVRGDPDVANAVAPFEEGHRAKAIPPEMRGFRALRGVVRCRVHHRRRSRAGLWSRPIWRLRSRCVPGVSRESKDRSEAHRLRPSASRGDRWPCRSTSWLYDFSPTSVHGRRDSA